MRELRAGLLKAGLSHAVGEPGQRHQLLHLWAGVPPEEGLDRRSPSGRAGAALSLAVLPPQQLLQEALAQHSLAPALALRSRATRSFR